MSTEYIQGIGYITFDPNKTEEEKQATIEYWKARTPEEVELGFGKGFDDVESIAYRAFEKAFLNTEDEEKRQWFETQIKEIGREVGYMDSIALETYYSRVKKERDLRPEEEETRNANLATMQEFQKDMYSAYENNSGDITEVSKKYGYEAPDISVLGALKSMAANPSYTAGAIAGMILKDPELLLLGQLGIPARIAMANKKLLQTARLATKIKPQYVKRFEQTLGRGVEGAVYGATYEGLHDLTFNGYIKSENVERGAAVGALLGSAFGAVTPTSKGWFLDKINSQKAKAKILDGESAFEPSVKNGESILTVKPDKVKEPKTKESSKPVEESTLPEEFKSSAMPKGINYKNRYEFWLERMKTKEREIAKPIIEEASPIHSKKGRTQEEIQQIEARRQANAEMVAKESEVGIVREINALASTLMKRNPNMKIGEARAEAALRIGRDKAFGEKLPNETTKDLGLRLEKERGKLAIEKEEPTPPKETFKEYLRQPGNTVKTTPSVGTLAKYGVAGGAVGYLSFDENPIFSAVLGAGIAALGRGKIKNINPDQARIKLSVLRKGRAGEQLDRHLDSQSAMLMNNIKKYFATDLEKTEFLFALEKGKTKESVKKSKDRIAAMTPEQKDVVDIWRSVMSKFKKYANKYKIFDKGFEKEYVSHVFKGEKVPKEWMEQFQTILKDKSKFGKQRRILKTIEEIKKEGKYDVVTDPIELLNIYSHSMTKSIAGALMVRSLQEAAIVDGKQVIGAIIPKTEKGSLVLSKRLGYKTSDLPALRDFWIHPEILKQIEEFYFVDTGSTAFWKKALVVNNVMKRIAVTASFFHAQALLFSGFYIGAFPGNLTKVGRLRMQRVKDALDGRWEDGKFVEADLMRELAEEGLGVGTMKTSQHTNPGYTGFKAFLDKYAPPLSKGQDWIDRITWDNLHDRSKIYSYLLKKEKALRRGANEKEARSEAATFVDDAFGGQSWRKLGVEFQEKAMQNKDNVIGKAYSALATATTPNKLRWANLGVFAPDWTASNLRIAFKGLIGGTKLAKKLISGVPWKKLPVRERVQVEFYLDYMLRAGIATTMMAYVMHEMFATEDKEFDWKDFWYTGRLDLGDGRQQVISKQAAEPIHFLTNPVHTSWNKMAAVPKMVFEIFSGKEYVSFKHGSVIGPKLNWDDPKAVAGYGLSKVTPISGGSMSSAIQDKIVKGKIIDWGDVFERTMFSGSGFPIYGKEDNRVKYK